MSRLVENPVDVVASAERHTVGVVEPPVVADAFARHGHGHRTLRGAGVGAFGSEEYGRPDPGASRTERVADHVYRLHADVLDVPGWMDLEMQPVVQESAEAFDRDGQVAFRTADEQYVVGVEKHVGDETAPPFLSVVPSAAARREKRAFGVMPCRGEIVVRKPLREVRADVQAAVPAVLVDEREDETQQTPVADVSGEHPFEHVSVYRRIAFDDVEFDEDPAVAFPHPFFDGLAGVVDSAAGYAGGLPSAYLRTEQRHEGAGRDVVVDLMLDGLLAYGPDLAADGLDVLVVCDGREVEFAGQDVVGDLAGESVEVGMAFAESSGIPPVSFAFEAGVDAFPDERRIGDRRVSAICFDFRVLFKLWGQWRLSMRLPAAFSV